MIIQMHEIPPEGREWNLDQKHQELREALRDLLGKQDFQVKLVLTPINPGTYTLSGSIQTQVQEQCSRCGDDFPLAVDENFQHILMPQLKLSRDAKVAKPNHYSDLHENAETGPDTVEYEGNAFNAGEFLHELVALAEPPIPAPPADAKGACSFCKIDLKNHSFSYDEEMEEPPKPLAGLKNLKLN